MAKIKEEEVKNYIFALSRQLNIEDTRGVMGNELELIALVRNCEFLYNKTLHDFKDNLKKEAAWEAIASVMHATVPEVQQRWRHLRDTYNRNRKVVDNNGELVKNWEFYDDMKFIEPHIVTRHSSRVTSTEHQDSSQENNFAENGIEQHSDILNLISAIKDRPILYDAKHPDYKDVKQKEQAWNEVARIVGASASECEMKWRYLRDRYGRERKLQSDPRRKPWEYFETLAFLRCCVRTRRRASFRRILPKPSESNITLVSVDSLPNEYSESIIIQTEEAIDEMGTLHKTEDLPSLEFVDATSGLSRSQSPIGEKSNFRIHNSYKSPSSHTSNQTVHDEDELFGQTIAAELRRITSTKKKMKIKADMYKLLYEHESNN